MRGLKIIAMFLLFLVLNSEAMAKISNEQKIKQEAQIEEPVTEGEISLTRVVGASVGTFTGFGLGHPIQGRYMERGWMFTTTQVLGLYFIASGGFLGTCKPGYEECGNQTHRLIGLALYFTFSSS